MNEQEALVKLTRDLEANIESRARTVILKVLTEIVSTEDLLLLSALGVDGRKKVLDVLITQCQTLMNESQEDT